MFSEAAFFLLEFHSNFARDEWLLKVTYCYIQMDTRGTINLFITENIPSPNVQYSRQWSPRRNRSDTGVVWWSVGYSHVFTSIPKDFDVLFYRGFYNTYNILQLLFGGWQSINLNISQRFWGFFMFFLGKKRWIDPSLSTRIYQIRVKDTAGSWGQRISYQAKGPREGFFAFPPGSTCQLLMVLEIPHMTVGLCYPLVNVYITNWKITIF